MSVMSLHCFHVQSKCMVLCDYIESWRFKRNCRQHCSCAGRGGRTWILPSDSLRQPVSGSLLTTGRDSWYRVCCTLWTQSRLWWAPEISVCLDLYWPCVFFWGGGGWCGGCQGSVYKWSIEIFVLVAIYCQTYPHSHPYPHHVEVIIK
jgi:hypothetical protein